MRACVLNINKGYRKKKSTFARLDLACKHLCGLLLAGMAENGQLKCNEIDVSNKCNIDFVS